MARSLGQLGYLFFGQSLETKTVHWNELSSLTMAPKTSILIQWGDRSEMSEWMFRIKDINRCPRSSDVTATPDQEYELNRSRMITVASDYNLTIPLEFVDVGRR